METGNGGSVWFTDNQTQQTNKTNVFEQVCTTAGAFCKKVRAILRAILSTIGLMASQQSKTILQCMRRHCVLILFAHMKVYTYMYMHVHSLASQTYFEWRRARAGKNSPLPPRTSACETSKYMGCHAWWWLHFIISILCTRRLLTPHCVILTIPPGKKSGTAIHEESPLKSNE